jgi:hypothetical protein
MSFRNRISLRAPAARAGNSKLNTRFDLALVATAEKAPPAPPCTADGRRAPRAEALRNGPLRRRRCADAAPGAAGLRLVRPRHERVGGTRRDAGPGRSALCPQTDFVRSQAVLGGAWRGPAARSAMSARTSCNRHGGVGAGSGHRPSAGAPHPTTPTPRPTLRPAPRPAPPLPASPRPRLHRGRIQLAAAQPRAALLPARFAQPPTAHARPGPCAQAHPPRARLTPPVSAMLSAVAPFQPAFAGAPSAAPPSTHLPTVSAPRPRRAPAV